MPSSVDWATFNSMSTGIRAVGLVSGGLDSALAVAVVKRAGVDVVGLHVAIGFSNASMRREILGESRDIIASEESVRMSAAFRVPVRVVDFSGEYMDVLLHPRHGYGANANPCIDCHIFMIKKAREIMVREGAHFVFTGEVLGQRPMSQNIRALELIDRESGLEGFLVRPLSARLLPGTVVEKNGWLDGDALLDIQGRSRRRQMELAAEMGVTGYSAPAGGCMLTDEHYAGRLKDWLQYRGSAPLRREETLLFSVGRHFRLSASVKLVVGRHEAEDLSRERERRSGWLASPLDVPGPTVLVQGLPSDDCLRVAASFVARYGGAKCSPAARVVVRRGDVEKIFTAVPASEDLIERCRI
ncbi:MAG: thiamine biosynthesis protein [Candidatus Krumholzibacteria bacterium]|nr:thiamine biosynthesis protein [Candidatus Krumholzibacteria bacterium]